MATALDWYRQALGAEVHNVIECEGKLGHAELILFGQAVMIADEFPSFHALSPRTIGGTPVTIYLQVPDVDGVVKGAVQAGAELLRTPENANQGERVAKIRDPYGHRWFLAGPLA
jgi:PhnB protein